MYDDTVIFPQLTLFELKKVLVRREIQYENMKYENLMHWLDGSMGIMVT